MMRLSPNHDMTGCRAANLLRELQLAIPFLEHQFRSRGVPTTAGVAEGMLCPFSAGCPEWNCQVHGPMPVDDGIQGSLSPAVVSAYFDFAKRYVQVGDERQCVGCGQPWRLVERAIRTRKFGLFDCFLAFDEWRSKRDLRTLERHFEVVLSKARSVIEPLGLGLARDDDRTIGCTLSGWDPGRHHSNVHQARAMLEEAVNALVSGRMDQQQALNVACKTLGGDPDSLPAALFAIQCLRNSSGVKVPAGSVKTINQLLRRQENAYAGAIAAMEQLDAMDGSALDEQLRPHRRILGEIQEGLQLARQTPEFRGVCSTEDTGVDAIIGHIQAIQRSRVGNAGDNMASHFNALLNSEMIQSAKERIVQQVRRRCPAQWAKQVDLDDEFDQCFRRLILERVNCTKLQYPGSLVQYVKKSIPSMMLDLAFQAVYELSYSQVGWVQKLRKGRDTQLKSLGRQPSDEDIATELGIKMECLRVVQAWEKQLGKRRLDTRCHGISRDDEESMKDPRLYEQKHFRKFSSD